ncbi:MAG: hypothetical protein JXR42_02595 [Gammaproteobacteria bacterium]|nr:hypothetical protein [Gammaproteobacteria bacterium]
MLFSKFKKLAAILLFFICGNVFAVTSSGYLYVPVTYPHDVNNPISAKMFVFNLSTNTPLSKPTLVSINDPVDTLSVDSSTVADENGNVYFYFEGGYGGENLLHGYSHIKGATSMTVFKPSFIVNKKVAHFGGDFPMEPAIGNGKVYIYGYTDSQTIDPHVWVYKQSDLQLNGKVQSPTAVSEIKLTAPAGTRQLFNRTIQVDNSGHIYAAFDDGAYAWSYTVARYKLGQSNADTTYQLPAYMYISHIIVNGDQVYAAAFGWGSPDPDAPVIYRLYRLIPGSIAQQVVCDNDPSQDVVDIAFDKNHNAFILHESASGLIVDMYNGMPTSSSKPIASYNFGEGSAATIAWSAK